MYSLRLWSVRHSRPLNRFYLLFERALIALSPLWSAIGYERLEPFFASFERGTKGLLFDCQMCGQCALSSTGMSCPMNCPKNLRNGPCGGVRENGHCEVKPEMKCVWVQAWNGAQSMDGATAILSIQPAIDHRLRGRSAWLRIVRMALGVNDSTKTEAPPKNPTARKETKSADSQKDPIAP